MGCDIVTDFAALDRVHIKVQFHDEWWARDIKHRVGVVVDVHESGMVHLRWVGTDDVETRLPPAVLERA